MKHSFCFSPRKKWCDGNGLHCPGPGDYVAYYTQEALNGFCVIPEPKPDAEKLVSAHCSVKINDIRVVDVTDFKDGHRVQGRKLIVSGIFRLGIEYSADTPLQKVHFFHCDIPFNTIILRCVDGKEYPLPQDFCLDNYVVHVCLEHLQVEQVSARSFRKAVVLMIWVQRKYPLMPDESKGDDDDDDDLS